jgi:hypothetical protein
VRSLGIKKMHRPSDLLYPLSSFLRSTVCRDLRRIRILTRSHLKNRILVQDQGGADVQPAGILKYSEELKRGPNTETCPPMAGWIKRLF